MDFNSLDRCGEISNIINKDNQKIVMIDHHQLPEDYADINFSFPNISSTCEIVYFIIEASSNLKFINKVVPNDRLFLETLVKSYKRGLATCEGAGIVKDKIVCKADFTIILPEEVKKYNLKSINKK